MKKVRIFDWIPTAGWAMRRTLMTKTLSAMTIITIVILMVSVNLTRIMSHIFHCIRTLYSTHTNGTYRCHKVTVLAKDVTSNLLGRETYDRISNVPSLTVSLQILSLMMVITIVIFMVSVQTLSVIMVITILILMVSLETLSAMTVITIDGKY